MKNDNDNDNAEQSPSNADARRRPVLYLIGMPLENPDDIGKRALELLRRTDLLLCEERKVAARFFKRQEIPFPRENWRILNEHTNPEEVEGLLQEIKSAQCPVVISDVGMPVLCDPGAELTQRAHQIGIKIVVVPGPSAFTAALAIAGVGGAGFHFLGFPPRKTEERDRFFRGLEKYRLPAVLYETPYRLKKLLGELHRHCPGNRNLFLAVNLTGKAEYTRRAQVRNIPDFIDSVPEGPPVVILY